MFSLIDSDRIGNSLTADNFVFTHFLFETSRVNLPARVTLGAVDPPFIS